MKPTLLQLSGAVLILAVTVSSLETPVRIGAESRRGIHPRSRFSRYVNWRPADGETGLRRNPPRMSWPYDPEWPQNPVPALHQFTLQISASPDLSEPVVDVTCAVNFYNALPVLRGSSTWYWRVGYDIGSDEARWSRTRSFQLAPDAVPWDRSALASPGLTERGHPRILFNQDNLSAVRRLAGTNEASRLALESMKKQADAIMNKPWWDAFPETDTEDTPKQSFYTIAGDLATVAFVWIMTEDPSYAGVKERAVTWASYPPGGRASPEGLGGDGNEDATQGNEFLALLFDWLYNDLTPDQRQVMVDSLAWRVDHIMNRFAWRRSGPQRGAMLRLTFNSNRAPHVAQAESLTTVGNTRIVRDTNAAEGAAVALLDEDAGVKATLSLAPGTYLVRVRGRGPAPNQDAFNIRLDDQPPQRVFIQSWGQASATVSVKNAGEHTIAVTADAGETGMLIDQITVGMHGDERLWLRKSPAWTRYARDVPVPQGATGVTVEAFNYYGGGEVWWDEVSVTDSDSGTQLSANPTFREGTADGPAAWSATRFGTEAVTRYVPGAGRDESAAVMIAGDDTHQRGSWGQRIDLGDTRRLHIKGWYRTTAADTQQTVPGSSLAGQCSSHQYEGSMDTAACALALYGHHPSGNEWFELISNYLVGITCGFGFDEGWNEGAGYGTSKCKWLMNATLYMDTALPQVAFSLNPYYERLGDWFSRIIPVGLDHHAWGNQANASRWNHLAHFRKLAYLTGEGRFLLNWQQYGGSGASSWRPWIEYVLPAHYSEPKPVAETSFSALFPIAGWAMAATGPPSLRSTYDEGAGVIFQCRPRGGYSHSFHSDGSFQLHAYGQMLNHGGGSSANQDAYAYHSMSHNTILVDGMGQAQPTSGMQRPAYGYIAGYAEHEDLVYMAGDMTGCYPTEPGSYRRWGLPLDSVYQERALGYLQRAVRHVLFIKGRYTVIYDDLACSQPATFTWLYHIRPDEPFAMQPGEGAVTYAVGDVGVNLRHASKPGELDFQDRQGMDAYVNPFTGEDYRQWKRGDILCGHNLWISNRTPAPEWRFLAVVAPTRQGQNEAEIRRLDDATVRIDDVTVCFDPAGPHAQSADILVDVEAFRLR